MITTDELKVQLADYGKAVKDLEEALAIDASRKRVQELEHTMSRPGFYDDAELSKKVFDEVGDLKGKHRDPKVANKIIESEQADFIGLGRQFVADPQWPLKVKEGRLDEVRKCISCNIGCSGHRIGLNRPIRCTINPSVNEGEAYKNQSKETM